MSRQVITVNQFDFCSEHGNELCYVCDQDYRSLNNKSADIKGRLSTKLGPNFEIDNGFLLEERHPINVYTFGVNINAHYPDGLATARCPDHKRVNCSECYDWSKLIEAEATGDGIYAVRGRTVRS